MRSMLFLFALAVAAPCLAAPDPSDRSDQTDPSDPREALPAPSTQAGNEELQAYLLEAAGHNPRLRAIYEEWRAAMERIPQATALEDPMFGYTQFVGAKMSQYGLMLEQRLPWFGTLRLRGERAFLLAEAIRWQMFDERNSIFASTKRAYYDYHFIFEQLRVIEEQLKLVAFASDLVMSQYELGMTGQDAGIRLEQQRSQLEDMRTQLQQMQAPIIASLNEALGRPIDQALPPPQPLGPPRAAPATEKLTALIRAHNPLLESKQQEIDSLMKDIDLAELQKYPEFSVRVEFMKGRDPGRMSTERLMPGRLMAVNDLLGNVTGMMPLGADSAINAYELFRYKEPAGDKDDNGSLTLQMSLPIWRKKLKAAVREAEHMAQSGKWDREAMAREIDRESRMSLFNLQDGERRHHLYQEVLSPKEKQAYETLQTAYASGGAVDFVALTESQQRLLEYQIEALRAVRDWHSAAAELEYYIGAPWSGEERAEETKLEVKNLPSPATGQGEGH